MQIFQQAWLFDLPPLALTTRKVEKQTTKTRSQRERMLSVQEVESAGDEQTVIGTGRCACTSGGSRRARVLPIVFHYKPTCRKGTVKETGPRLRFHYTNYIVVFS